VELLPAATGGAAISWKQKPSVDAKVNYVDARAADADGVSREGIIPSLGVSVKVT
jgi:hypothetical protein